MVLAYDYIDQKSWRWWTNVPPSRATSMATRMHWSNMGLLQKPLDAAIRRLLAPYCPGSRLSWVCWRFVCQEKVPNDTTDIVGPTCLRHVSQHVADMTPNRAEESADIVELTCCRRHVSDMLEYTDVGISTNWVRTLPWRKN